MYEMSREKEPKNAFARKIQQLTRSRSSSTTPSFAAPPSPSDYFTHGENTDSHSAPYTCAGAPLTPVTPTGLPGTVGPEAIGVPVSAQPLSSACPYCKLPTDPEAISHCCCNAPEPLDSLVESEAIADKMAQKILHQVVSQSEQGWII